MGVDISFHIEVHRKGKWHALAWQTPKALESEPIGEDKWVTHHCCCTFRYHQIEYFLQDKGVSGLPDDVTKETVACLRENYGKGWFRYADFVEFLQEKKENLFKSLSQCKEMEVINRLERIEQLARGNEVPVAEESGFGGFETQEIIEDYEDSIVFLEQLYWAVQVLTHDLVSEDIRIVYEMW